MQLHGTGQLPEQLVKFLHQGNLAAEAARLLPPDRVDVHAPARVTDRRQHRGGFWSFGRLHGVRQQLPSLCGALAGILLANGCLAVPERTAPYLEARAHQCTPRGHMRGVLSRRQPHPLEDVGSIVAAGAVQPRLVRAADEGRRTRWC